MTEPAVSRRRSLPVQGMLFAVLLGAALLMMLVAHGPGVLPFDRFAADAIQGQDPAPAVAAYATTNVVGLAPVATVTALAIAAVFGVAGRPHAASLLALAPTAWLANAALKAVAASPRPLAGELPVVSSASGYGFPSGHVMGTTVLALLIFALAWRGERRRWIRAALVVAVATLLLVSGLGRIAVGAHWPSDVLGGYLWGGVLALVLLRLHGAVVSRYAARRRRGDRGADGPELGLVPAPDSFAVSPGPAVRTTPTSGLRRTSAGAAPTLLPLDGAPR